MKVHQHINQDSGDTEYYTPIEIVDKARAVMGDIDLDPASSARANERIVRAEHYFSSKENGLLQSWHGRVWMNHPFSRQGNKAWIRKLIYEFTAGNITQACCITFAATSEQWFQPLMQYPQCFLSPRTNYYLPDGSLKRGVTKGSVVTYLGTRVGRFVREFEPLGAIKVKYRV